MIIMSMFVVFVGHLRLKLHFSPSSFDETCAVRHDSLRSWYFFEIDFFRVLYSMPLVVLISHRVLDKSLFC